MRFMPLALAMSFGLAAPALAAARLTIEDVRNMAFDKGIVKIEEVELHNGIWKVEGEDASGYEIKMKVDAFSGESSSSSVTTRPYFSAPTIALRGWGLLTHQSFFRRHRSLYWVLSARVDYGDKQPS
jgi:hypothetical protein